MKTGHQPVVTGDCELPYRIRLPTNWARRPDFVLERREKGKPVRTQRMAEFYDAAARIKVVINHDAEAGTVHVSASRSSTPVTRETEAFVQAVFLPENPHVLQRVVTRYATMWTVQLPAKGTP